MLIKTKAKNKPNKHTIIKTVKTKTKHKKTIKYL